MRGVELGHQLAFALADGKKIGDRAIQGPQISIQSPHRRTDFRDDIGVEIAVLKLAQKFAQIDRTLRPPSWSSRHAAP